MKNLEKFESKLFNNMILDQSDLQEINGGAEGGFRTWHRTGVSDTSDTKDHDKCWSLGPKDEDEDCSLADLGGFGGGFELG